MMNANMIGSDRHPDIDRITDELLGGERRIPLHTSRMPSIQDLKIFIREINASLFPGFFSRSGLDTCSLRHAVASSVDNAFHILSEQIQYGICFSGGLDEISCDQCESRASEMAGEFISSLPRIRELLDGDVVAAYNGDPAAKSLSETIFCYPSIRIMTHHRVAHELYRLGVPLLPRMISEMAHSRTGIDIHPGAKIGEEFFIDHGTGVVIGETAEIGRRCRLYQGVTLGALSFPKDEHGNPIKDLPRHPLLEDNVTVYGGATILGRVTIGSGSIIGGNVWLTESVPPCSKVVQSRSTSAPSSETMLGCEYGGTE